MTATIENYACRFASERLLAGVGGQPPFLGCGISTDWHGTDMATLGGSSTRANGSIKPTAARRDDLIEGWRAFKAQPDSNGIPDTSDLIRIHRGMFRDLPDPERFFTREWDAVIARLDRDDAVSIALKLSVLGATNTIDETTADHQVLMFRRRGDSVTVMGPMRRQRESYHGHRAKLSEIRKAALAIEGGLILCWLYPIGGWTQAALQTEGLRDRVRELRRDNEGLGTVNAGLRERIAERNAESVRLENRIRQLEAGQVDCQPLIENARAAGREQALVQASNAIEALRSQ